MKNAIRLLALVTLAGAGVVVTACSSTTTTGDGGAASSTTTTTTPTSTTSATGTTPGTDAGTPTGPDLNGCKTYVDRTADGASREITWNLSVATTPEACIKVKAGQTVTWKGDFAVHPLAPKGGDANSPIKSQATNTFPTAGSFGFVCTNHASMTGVVFVVP